MLLVFVLFYLSHIWVLCADEGLDDIVGSAYYVAPEVLYTSYSLEARK